MLASDSDSDSDSDNDTLGEGSPTLSDTWPYGHERVFLWSCPFVASVSSGLKEFVDVVFPSLFLSSHCSACFGSNAEAPIPFCCYPARDTGCSHFFLGLSRASSHVFDFNFCGIDVLVGVFLEGDFAVLVAFCT